MENRKLLPLDCFMLEIATLQIFFLAFKDDAVLISHNAEGL